MNALYWLGLAIVILGALSLFAAVGATLVTEQTWRWCGWSGAAIVCGAILVKAAS